MAKTDTPNEPEVSSQNTRGTRQAGVLTKADIKRHGLITGKVNGFEIDNFKEEPDCYQLSCYDLRVGREYIIFGDKEQFPGKTKDGGIITIPAFGAALISSYEMIVTRENIVGRFNVRFKAALKGIIVQMGTQIEPNYSGFLFAIVQNITNKDIELEVGRERLFTVEFYYTNTPCGNTGQKNIFYIDDIKHLMRFEETINHFNAEIKRLAEGAKKASLEAKNASGTAIEASNKANDASKEAKEAAQFKKMIALTVLLVVFVPVGWTIGIPIVFERAVISSDTKATIMTLPKLIDGMKLQVDMYKTATESIESVTDNIRERVDVLEKQTQRADSNLHLDNYDQLLRRMQEQSLAVNERVAQLEKELSVLRSEQQVLKSKQENQAAAAAPNRNAKAPVR